MTAPAAVPPEPPARPVTAARADTRAPEREPPTWSELGDALYLAACQDAAMPLRDAPGRPPVRRTAGRTARPQEPQEPQERQERQEPPGP
ncbi:hypothetical protein ACWF94_03485, partial [Streptomyces sp. NPDC055078]